MPVSPGASGMQARDPCRPWRGTLASGHKPRCFNICCKAGLVVLNSLNFCLFEKFLISPSVLKEILARYSNLGCRFFRFSTLNISYHSLLACGVSAERSAIKCMGLALCVTCCFSLAAFNILSLCLVFVSLISICLGVFLLGFILYGTLCACWT